MDGQKEAWERLYSSQERPWRGSLDLSWTGIPAETQVLDIGCGNGKSQGSLIQMGCSVTGVDISETAVGICRDMYPDGRFITADAGELPFPDGFFGAAVAIHCLEHLDEEGLEAALREIKRVLAHPGDLYIQVFGEGDFRAEGKKEDVRNGIRYRYFDEFELRKALWAWNIVSIETVVETTRFGERRVRIRCIARSM